MDQALPHRVAFPFHSPASGRVNSTRAESTGSIAPLQAVALVDHPPLAESGSSESESLEDPDSPGRSPRPLAGAGFRSTAELDPLQRTEDLDPLRRSLGVVAGFAIALLTLFVPLVSVLADRPSPEGSGSATPGRLPLLQADPAPDRDSNRQQ
jgi:hypothetical protein